MPTRKQRKRIQKERRHEYETVWVDAEGNELEEPPDDAPAAARERRSDARKPQAKRSQPTSAHGRPAPPPPSWRRSARRSLILGVLIFAVFAVLSTKGGKHQYGSSLAVAVLYTALFIPFTYYIDRFAYRRAQRRASEQPKKR
jgi:hypothetical protein